MGSLSFDVNTSSVMFSCQKISFSEIQMRFGSLIHFFQLEFLTFQLRNRDSFMKILWEMGTGWKCFTLIEIYSAVLISHQIGILHIQQMKLHISFELNIIFKTSHQRASITNFITTIDFFANHVSEFDVNRKFHVHFQSCKS